MRRALALVCVLVLLPAIGPLGAQTRERAPQEKPPAPRPERRAPPPEKSEPLPASSPGIWIDRSALASLPMRGAGWNNVIEAAGKGCGTPDLSNQEDGTNVCIMAKALAFARTREPRYGIDVRAALRSIVEAPQYRGRALSLGRELAAYVIAADLVDLRTLDRELDAS